MLEIEKTLSKVTERHQVALQWFATHACHERSWPGSLSDGTLLASKAKGIYKPGWTEYALSVRESLGGPYSDRDPKLRSDGTWSYGYFQENTDPRPAGHGVHEPGTGSVYGGWRSGWRLPPGCEKARRALSDTRTSCCRWMGGWILPPRRLFPRVAWPMSVGRRQRLVR